MKIVKKKMTNVYTDLNGVHRKIFEDLCGVEDDVSGRIVVPIEYTEIKLYDGFFLCRKYGDFIGPYGDRDKKIAIVDLNGRKRVEVEMYTWKKEGCSRRGISRWEKIKVVELSDIVSGVIFEDIAYIYYRDLDIFVKYPFKNIVRLNENHLLIQSTTNKIQLVDSNFFIISDLLGCNMDYVVRLREEFFFSNGNIYSTYDGSCLYKSWCSDARMLNDKFIVVKRNGICGAISSVDFSKVLSYKYSEIIEEVNGLFHVCFNGIDGWVNDKDEPVYKNKEGKYVPKSNNFMWQGDYENGRYKIYYEQPQNKEVLTGYIDEGGNFILDCNENGNVVEIHIPHTLNYDWYMSSDTGHLIFTYKDNRYGIIDSSLSIILQPIYDEIYSIMSSDEKGRRCFVAIKFSEKVSIQVIVNEVGDVIFQRSYKDTFSNEDERFYIKRVKLFLNDLLLIDGNENVAPTVINFDGNVYLQEYKGRYVGYDKKNELQETWEYELVNGFKIVKNNGLKGVLSPTGDVIVPIEYKDIQVPFCGGPSSSCGNEHITVDGLLKVSDGVACGVVDYSGKFVVPLSLGYSDVSPVNKNYFIVEKDKTVGVVDGSFRIIVPLAFERIVGSPKGVFICLNLKQELRHEIEDKLDFSLIEQDYNFKDEDFLVNFRGQVLGSHCYSPSWKYRFDEKEDVYFRTFEYDSWPHFTNGVKMSECITGSSMSMKRIGPLLYSFQTTDRIYHDWDTGYYSNANFYWIVNSDGIVKLRGLSGIGYEEGNKWIKIYNEHNLVGLSDLLGNEVVPIKYKSIRIQKNNTFIVQNANYLYGVLDSNYKELIPARFPSLDYVESSSVYTIKGGGAFTNDGRYIEERTKISIDKKFLKCDSFVNGYAIATMLNEKGDEFFGLINILSEEVVPVIYEYMRNVEDDVYAVKQNSLYGLIVSLRVKVEPQYKYLKYCNSGFIIVSKIAGEEECYGVIDKNGNTVLPTDYEYIGIPSEGKCVVMQHNLWGIYDIEQKHFNYFDGASYISKMCGGICTIKFDNLKTDIKNNSCVSIKSNKLSKWFIYDKEFKKINKTPYQYLWGFYENNVAVAKINGFYGVVNKTNEIVADFEYEERIQDFKDGKAKFANGDIVYTINTEGYCVNTTKKEHEIYDYDDDFDEQSYQYIRGQLIDSGIWNIDD